MGEILLLKIHEMEVNKYKKESDHGFNVFVDFFTSVAPMTIFGDWFSQSWDQKSFRSCQLERINELLNLVELFSYIDYFIDDIFEAENVTTDLLFDQLVWLDLNSFAVDLSVGLLVEEFADNFLWRLSPSDIVFDGLESGQYLGGDFNKDGSVDLSQSKLVQG